LLEALAGALEKKGKSIKDTGITGIFSGGTSSRRSSPASPSEEMLDNGAVYMTPTYGNS